MSQFTFEESEFTVTGTNPEIVTGLTYHELSQLGSEPNMQTCKMEELEEEEEETSQPLEDVVIFQVQDSNEFYGVQLVQDEDGNLQKYQFQMIQHEDGQFEPIPDTIQLIPFEDEELKQIDADFPEHEQQESDDEVTTAVPIMKEEYYNYSDDEFEAPSLRENYEEYANEDNEDEHNADEHNEDEQLHQNEMLQFVKEDPQSSDAEYSDDQSLEEDFIVTPDVLLDEEQDDESNLEVNIECEDMTEEAESAMEDCDSYHSEISLQSDEEDVLKQIEEEHQALKTNNLNQINSKKEKRTIFILKRQKENCIIPRIVSRNRAKCVTKIKLTAVPKTRKVKPIKNKGHDFKRLISETKIVEAPVRQERLPRKQKIEKLFRSDEKIELQEIVVQSDGIIETKVDGVITERKLIEPIEFIQLSDDEKPPRKSRKSKPNSIVIISDSEEEISQVSEPSSSSLPEKVTSPPSSPPSSPSLVNQCPQCPKSFPSLGSLRTHMHSHTYENTNASKAVGKSLKRPLSPN